ncbi:MAG: Hsp70 family protein [Yaniella sp.]|nr:Hsp70 family protein [Yaniella sp.]
MQKVEWFKLQLMLSGNTYIDPINLPPLPPGKSEIDVAADYLFKLRQAIRAQLQKALGEVFTREERNIRYYLTVPAIWNDAGKAATRTAAIQAGFLRDENDNRLTLVSEPEAAALFCAKSGLLNLKVGDAILIVDCGGGTVDLIAYEVEEEQPVSVMECTAGAGDSCGSTALNRNFSNILRAKIRKMKLPDGSRTAGKVYAKCIMDFENRIKADFRNNGQKWAVDVGIEADFPDAGIEEGYMTFMNEEILQCFEPVVNRILELVRNQIIAIQAQNRLIQVRASRSSLRPKANEFVERPGRRWIRCFRIPLPANQAPRAATVSDKGCPPDGLGGCDRQGCSHRRYYRAGHHTPCSTSALPYGHASAIQGGLSPGTVPCAQFGRSRSMQVHPSDFRPKGRACQDW